MPFWSRIAIRSAALNMIVGLALWSLSSLFAAGSWAALATAVAIPGIHLVVMGGLTQMVFGVAWWMFPVRKKDRGRGSPIVAAVAWFAINTGSYARLAGSVSLALGHEIAGRALLGAAAIILPLAPLAFAAMILGRIRGPAERTSRT